MKRALLVGIDDYDHFSALGGCVNDVLAVHPLLARHGDATLNFDCVTRTAEHETTRDHLLADLDALFAPSADVALFYFAGHGAAVDNDVVLATRDGTKQTPGIAFSELLTKVQNSTVPEIIVVLDCCFAGGAGGVPQLGSAAASLRPGVVILTASRADQTSAETLAGRGLFSTYLEGALDGGAADVLGKITVAGVYAYLSELFGPWDQRPMFKANVDRLNVLRSVEPAVSIDKLKTLAGLFPTATYELQLDPSYEPTEQPKHPEHEADFKVLQECRAAKLVEPIDEDHLYYVAMNSKSCRLTALGRHYWRLVSQGRL